MTKKYMGKIISTSPIIRKWKTKLRVWKRIKFVYTVDRNMKFSSKKSYQNIRIPPKKTTADISNDQTISLSYIN